MNRWNKADTVLILAALLFLMAIILKIIFSSCPFTEGFLFVTEAALIGGIADWFAVTALFKKPLGFPIHTAILPRRRDEFVNASVQMVQQEFFSRRMIFKKFSDFKLLPHIIEFLNRDLTRKIVTTELFNLAKNFIANQNKKFLSKKISNKLREIFSELPAPQMIINIGKQLKRRDQDRELFIKIVKSLRKTAAKPETCNKLQKILEEYAAEKNNNMSGFSKLMAGLAQMFNLVNFEEAAQIMQTQLLKLLDELIEHTEFQQRVVDEYRLKFSELSDTISFKELVDQIQIDVAANLPLESAIELSLYHLESQLQTPTPKNFGGLFQKLLEEEYDKFLKLLNSDSSAKVFFEKFVDELVARTALYAQPLIGSVARSALSRMTEEQLNDLVYDKAEQDFIWIRLNGSIVGSVVGLIIFILIQVTGLNV